MGDRLPTVRLQGNILLQVTNLSVAARRSEEHSEEWDLGKLGQATRCLSLRDFKKSVLTWSSELSLR